MQMQMFIGEMRTVACHLNTPLLELGLLCKHSILNLSKISKIPLLIPKG